MSELKIRDCNFKFNDGRKMTFNDAFVAGANYWPVAGTDTHINQDYNPSSHKGVDIIPAGNGIVAHQDGTVIYTYNGCPHINDMNDTCNAGTGFGSFGNCVLIRHIDGHYSFYAHLQQGSILVGTNQAVYAGQKLATMGSSGMASGIHLHFETRTGNYPATAYSNLTPHDPNDYLNTATKLSQPI